MASVPITSPPGFDELSVEEKLDYLEALWARVVSKPEQIPVVPPNKPLKLTIGRGRPLAA
jgi:hypothetical protein